MEEAIKLIEEHDKVRFNSEAQGAKEQDEEDDIFNDEVAVKKFQLNKATTQVRKNIEKQKVYF